MCELEIFMCEGVFACCEHGNVMGNLEIVMGEENFVRCEDKIVMGGYGKVQDI